MFKRKDLYIFFFLCLLSSLRYLVIGGSSTVLRLLTRYVRVLHLFTMNETVLRRYYSLFTQHEHVYYAVLLVYCTVLVVVTLPIDNVVEDIIFGRVGVKRQSILLLLLFIRARSIRTPSGLLSFRRRTDGTFATSKLHKRD